jgi:CPA2 family monovalent cation:H+ antiporter-2
MPMLLLSIPILTDVVIILALSIPVILLLHYLKLPSIVGFLVTGVLAGPYVLELVTEQAHIDILAEIGVILLLFTIGMEFSVPNLLKIKHSVLLGGGLQLLLTTVAFGCITYFREYDDLSIALFYGFLCTLSSTAIVLKILQLRGEMKTAHGQTILAILIFQDIAVVPAMLLLPMINSGTEESIGMKMLVALLKAIGIIILLIILSKYVIKWFLDLVVNTRSTELFISTIVVFCFSIAYLTSLAGLSLALGAFLAGLVLSESEYAHKASEIVLPFKEIFTSIFFVSIGMLMDVNFFMNNVLQILLYTLESIVVQAVMAFIAIKLLGMSNKTALLTAIGICQIGEFAFILAKSGIEVGLMPVELYQYFLAVSVLTMAFAPILIFNSSIIITVFSKIKTRILA